MPDQDQQGSDGASPPDLADEARCLLHGVLAERRPEHPWASFQLNQLAAGRKLVRAGRDLQLQVLIEALGETKRLGDREEHHAAGWAYAVVDALCRRSLQVTQGILEAIGDLWEPPLCFQPVDVPIQSGFLAAVERIAKGETLSPALRRAVQNWADHHSDGLDRQQAISMELRVSRLLGEAPEIHLEQGEPWSDQLLEWLQAQQDADRMVWSSLLLHAITAKAGQPSKKWLQAARTHLDAVGEEAFGARLRAALERLDQPKADSYRARPYSNPDGILNPELLKGLAWYLGAMDPPEPALAPALGRAALSAYRKIPGVGPRSVAVGNALVWALGRFDGLEGVSQLAHLKVKVKFLPAQKGIAKALVETAARLGISPDEIEEVGIPTHGMQTVGLRTEELAGFTAELRVTGTTSTRLTWRKPDGKMQKSVPKVVKEQCAEELQALKAAAKDIIKMLPAHRERLDGMLLSKRSWPLPVWQERYLDQPLVGTLARRLIWTFRTEDTVLVGCFRNGHLVSQEDVPLTGLGPETSVRLWHPLDASVADVLAWRDWLARHQIQQPFKQAHREVYLLTDAERHTEVYSNRFASHVLKQHQFHALCGVRGWRNRLRLLVDDTYPPATRMLPEWGLRAEYWVEGVGEDYGTDTTESGSFLRVTTDQVRFYPMDAPQRSAHASGGGYSFWDQSEDRPVPLADVPPLVLSEVLRDVDLFVGVASIGNDPTWEDGGPEGRFRDYWQSYSFGDLSESAQTRRTILESLVPKLAIANRCTFQDRFLVVEGSKRTYKIHLGSGNILMEPNDQYLCIVKGAKGDHDKIFLPFEGDAMLSLILSKAFLLAADDKITDDTILTQLGP